MSEGKLEGIWNVLFYLIVAPFFLAGAFLAIMDIVWTYRAFSGGWVPFWGDVSGSFGFGIFFLMVGGAIVTTLICIVLSLVMIAIVGVVAAIQKLFSE